MRRRSTACWAWRTGSAARPRQSWKDAPTMTPEARKPETDYTPRDWASQPPYIHPDYKSTVLRGPLQPLVPLEHTLSELTGPVYGHESVGPLDDDLTRNGAKNGQPL